MQEIKGAHVFFYIIGYEAHAVPMRQEPKLGSHCGLPQQVSLHMCQQSHVASPTWPAYVE